MIPNMNDKESLFSISPADFSSWLEGELPVEIKGLFRSLGQMADELSIRAYVVGGFVRDLLLGVPNLDVDLVVEGDGIDFAQTYAAKAGGRVKRHKRFGTAILVLPGRFKVDVATARTERYERPGALPVVEPGNIEQDLYRRDFTINSMAICINPREFGRLIDPFGGLEDLRQGRIEALHAMSFVDDPTRILRAVRFEARYRFRIAPWTEGLIRKAMAEGMLDQVTGERIRQELVYILSEEDPTGAVKRLEEFRVLQFFNPRLSFGAETQFLYRWIPEAIDQLRELHTPVQRWAVYLLALLFPLPLEDTLEFHRRLRFSRRTREAVGQLEPLRSDIEPLLQTPEEIPVSRIYYALRGLHPEVLALLLARAGEGKIRERVLTYLERLKDVRPEIGGEELKALGIPPGPIYREALEAVLQAKLDGLLRGKEEELDIVRKLWWGKSSLR